MPVLSDEDVGLSTSKALSDEDVGLGNTPKILTDADVGLAELTEADKAAKSLAETRDLVRSSRIARGVLPTTPLDTDAQRRADALREIQQGQEQSKYFTEKERELGLMQSALDIPGAVKALVNLPNRLTGQPDYPPLISPEQAQKAREFLSNPLGMNAPTAPSRFDLVAPEKAKQIEAASERAIDQLVSGLSAPENVAAAVLAKRFPTPVATAFAGETIGAIPETTQRLLESKTIPEAVETGIPTVANLALAKVLGSHLVGPKAPPLPETQIGEPRPIPFPPEATAQDILESQRRAAYVAEQKAALEPPAVSEETLDRLAKEALVPSPIRAEPTPKPVEATPPPSTEAPKVKMVAASFRTPDGKVFSGIDHMDAAMKAEESGVKVDESMAGFTGEDGKFYDRDEALKAAQGQIEPTEDTFDKGKLHTGKLKEPFVEPVTPKEVAPSEAKGLPQYEVKQNESGKWQIFRNGEPTSGEWNQRGSPTEVATAEWTAAALRRGDLEQMQNNRAFAEERISKNLGVSKQTIERAQMQPPEGYELQGDSYVPKTQEPTPVAETGKKEAKPVSDVERLRVGDIITENKDGTGMKLRVDAVDPNGLDTVITEIQTGGKSNPYSPGEKRLRQESFERGRWFIQPEGQNKPTPPPAKAQAEVTRSRADDIRDELKSLRQERSEILKSVGGNLNNAAGNKQLGGLAPTKVRYAKVAGDIKRLQEELRILEGKPKIVVSPKVKGTSITQPKGQGLLLDVTKNGQKIGEIGRDNFGKLYIVKNGEVVGDNFKTVSEARDALVEAPKKQQPTPPTSAEGPTVVSGEERSPSALGVSPTSLSLSMTVNPKLVPAIRGTLKTVSGETMPKTTMANREAGEAGARYGSSPFYAHYAARALSETVLPHNSPIEPKLLGAALTEDALRGRHQEFLRKAASAASPEESANYAQMASNVGTLVGRFGVFRDEAALQAFIRQPDVVAAVDRLKQLYSANLDPLAEAAGLDITKKPQGGGLFPGAFINLFVPREGGLPSRTTVKTRPVGEVPVPGARGPSAGTPKLTATVKKRSRFGLQRTGASDIYGVDFHDMVANAFGGFTEIARKNEFDKALTDAGLAKIQQESPGQGWTHFPYEKRQLLGLEEGDVNWSKTINKGVWVRNDLAPEYARVSNVYRNEFSNTAIKFILDAVDKFQMLGILDATFHSSALLRRLWEAPLGKGDTALSLLRPADVARRLSMVADNIFQDRLSRNQKLAELANIGALTGHGQIKPHQIIRRTVNFLEENIRLTLSDMYDRLIQEGAPDTETARREYINAGLQYNRRFQGPVVNFLRKSGLGPFVTAGRTGLARGIRRWFLQDWIPGQDGPSRAWIAGNILTKMAGTALIIGVINHLRTGRWTGRPGTPLGNVDTGKDDEKTGKPLSVPLANLMGSEMRGGRALGLKAVAEGLRDNAPLSQIIDSAYKDSFNAISHPGLGPAVQALYGVTYGRPTAIGAPDYPKVAPGSGQSQTVSNIGHAFEELNPMIVRAGRNIVSWATGGKIEPSEEGPMERVKGVALQKGQKPMTPEEKQEMITFAQLRKYTDYLTSQARQLPREKRHEFILEQFDKDKLGDEFRKKAMEQITRHGVFKYD